MVSAIRWQKLARVLAGVILAALSVFFSFAAAQDEPQDEDAGLAREFLEEARSRYRVVFDAETKVIRRMVSSRKDVETITTPVYSAVEGLLRFEGRFVTVSGKGGEREQSYTYSEFQTTGGYLLPTRLSVGGGASETLFSFRYTCINGIKTEEDAVDIAALKTKIKECEKRYPRADSPEKIHLLRELALLDHELAAMAIVKRGLKDKDLAVRVEAARLLGQMDFRNVVSHLTNAMKPNHANQEVHLAFIAALGEIGDPKAIPYLYKDLWNQKERSDRVEATRAKIAALGRIESKKSVEALIDLISKFGSGRRGSNARYVGNITDSLQQLTGQNLGRDTDAWKTWWKKNRSKLKLAEDR